MKITGIEGVCGTTEAIIATTWQPFGFIGRWLGMPGQVDRWRGSGTVWHNAETGDRAPSHFEWRFSGQWTRWRWTAPRLGGTSANLGGRA